MKKSELFYEQRLLTRWLNKIEGFRKINKVYPDVVLTTSEYKTEKIDQLPELDMYSEVTLPHNYGGVDSYMWTKANFVNLDPHIKYFGCFDFGTGSGGLTVGAETLLYADNREVAGIDLNHEEINVGLLKSNQSLDFRTWSGIADKTRLEELEYIQGERNDNQYHQISKLYLFELDEKINNLYYNLYAMLEAYEVLKTDDVNTASILISDLSKLFLKYDEIDINRDLLLELNAKLQVIIDDYPQTSLIKMIAVGQTHIDLAWLWRVKHTREKAARSFSTMLNLMDNNPEYTFFQSQPQLFEFIKEDYPQIYKRIQAYVKEGRIDIDGAMWLEADCNIPSGESLTRQILYGKQFIKEEFGTESEVLWMPDVFGYSWAMPQILKKSGVKTFCTTKMQWNQQNRMPFNTFNWKGIDGTNITTHLIEDFSFYTINAKSMLTGSKNYKDKDISKEILYQYGFGDGGGGPRQKDIELVKRFNKIPGLPSIEYDTATNYFNKLNNKITSCDSYVHTWDGELYLELHRGTFTSQAAIKKSNRKLEFKFRELEMKIVKAKQDGHNISTLHKDVSMLWRKLLLNQFHDIIPGSSIHAVNVDAVMLYKEIATKLTTIEKKIAQFYPQSENSFVVFNSFNKELTTTIKYETDQSLEFYIEEQKLTTEYIGSYYLIKVPNLKPLAYTTIQYKICDNQIMVQNDESKIITDISTQVFSTDFYDIKFNNQAQITYLYNKQLERNVVLENNVLNKVVSYEDKPLDWDAWDIDIYYKNRERVLQNAERISIKTQNQLETVLEFKFKHLDSIIAQEITLSNITPRIDIKHNVDWNNPHRLLRVLCETGIRATSARFDIQYGNVERPTHDNTSWDIQKFEVLGHKWGDISNTSYGISLLNDCKYGYNAKNGILGLSLIKAAQFPDKTQDIGNHTYTYSIYVHANNVLSSNVETESFMLNNEFEPTNISVNNDLIVDISKDNVLIDAIKISEDLDDIIIRLHEYRNSSEEFNLNINYTETDLLESEIINSNMIEPYEIKTIRIKEESND